MGLIGIILIIIAILGLMGIFHILTYNKIQFVKTKIDHVEGLIDENLRNKYDLIIRANDTINKNLKTKKEYLKEFKNLKNEKISNFDLDRRLKEAENIIDNLHHDYEKLANNENIIEIIEELKKVNEKLTASISYYNKQTSTLNNYIRKFPFNIIAFFHHIKSKTYFDGKDMNDNDIFDFKL